MPLLNLHFRQFNPRLIAIEKYFIVLFVFLGILSPVNQPVVFFIVLASAAFSFFLQNNKKRELSHRRKVENILIEGATDGMVIYVKRRKKFKVDFRNA